VPRYVAILEDNILRIAEMRAALMEVLPQYRVVVFDEAPQMIQWLGEHLGEVVLISLDHDLPVTFTKAGQPVECGNGQDITSHLAPLPPVCPVIVHSANLECAVRMQDALQKADWPHVRITPHDGESWIGHEWVAAIRKFKESGLIFE
jgi:hypothetical protein